MKTVKLVIFDMDGLMFDTEQLSMNCWMQAANTLGVRGEMAAFRKTVGRDVVDSDGILRDHLGQDFPFERALKLRDRYCIEYVEKNGTPLKPGLLELLAYLEKRNISKVIATSTEQVRATRMIRCAGVENRFDGVVFGNIVDPGNPVPDIFLHAIGDLPQEDCLVLEDSPAGVEAAWQAGIPVILISDLVEPDAEALSRCTARKQSLLEVVDYLDN